MASQAISNHRSEKLGILLKILVVIAVIEVLIMVLLGTFDLGLTEYTEPLIDATLLSVLSAPVLYIWVIQPYINSHFKSENQLKQYKYAIEQHGIVAVTDVQGTIVEVNDHFCEISGYSRDELVGQNHRLLNSGSKDKGYWEQMYRTVAGGRIWNDEILNRAKDGHFYWVDTTIVPFFYIDGKPEKYIAIRTDISKIKHAEIELRRSNESLSDKNKELESTQSELQNAIEKLAENSLELQSEVAQRRSAESELEHLALYDSLTNLPNRRSIEQKAKKIMAEARKNEQMVGVLFVDLDGFKAVNDKQGDEIGDLILVQVSLRIEEEVRDTDVTGRLGSDEFVVLLPDRDSVDDIDTVASGILDSLSQPFEALEIHETLSASIGVAIFPDDSDNWEKLLRQADRAMFQSKITGKNQVIYYQEVQ